MKSIPLTALMVVAIAALATPAQGQALSERIAAVKAEKARQAEAAKPKPKVKILQSLLYTKLSVNFDKTPSRDAFEYIKTALGINLIVRYLDDEVGHGIDPQTPITIEAENMPALELLSMVIEQCEISEACTWQLRNSFLEVGTKDRLSTNATRELRTYPIEALLFEPANFTDAPSLDLNEIYQQQLRYRSYPRSGLTGSIGFGSSSATTVTLSTQQRAQELVQLIIDTIDTSGWEQNGGDWASIRYYDGLLIVNAPDFIHRQIDGYPDVPKPAKSKPTDKKSTAKNTQDPSQEKKP
ncbi:MAG: hypothetical protein IH859_08710 [Chloroflexi bacterium]|nr:hypothetical protein [Chloroflexota bacterium]